MYYDKKGNRISMESWAALVEDFNYKLVKVTEIADVKVSTVWLPNVMGGGGRRSSSISGIEACTWTTQGSTIGITQLIFWVQCPRKECRG